MNVPFLDLKAQYDSLRDEAAESLVDSGNSLSPFVRVNRMLILGLTQGSYWVGLRVLPLRPDRLLVVPSGGIP